jgi:E1-E2 ATPase
VNARAVRVRGRSEEVLLVVALSLLIAGGLLSAAGAADAAHAVWAVATVAGIVPACWWVIDAARHRRFGVDALAVLALVGTLVIGEFLAGAVIALMLASGRSLEARAARRAQRELHALLVRAPRIVHRYTNGELTSPPIDDVAPGDLLVVEPGEVVPVDGRIESAAAPLRAGRRGLLVARRRGAARADGRVSAVRQLEDEVPRHDGARCDLDATVGAEPAQFDLGSRRSRSNDASPSSLPGQC